MHQEVIDFCLTVKKAYPKYFTNRNVLDCGSLDINGNNRYLFSNCKYLGVDLSGGKNVDVACSISDLYVNMGSNQFGVIICTEVLEHDKEYQLSCFSMLNMLKPGGLLIITAATEGREEHGTHRNKPEDSPETNDYYKNITVPMLQSALLINDSVNLFSEHEISIKGTDIRFFGIKKV